MSNIKKNFIYNIVYQILIMILPLITTPYISRVLGTEGIGVYSYTYSIVYYFILFAMLGINNYGNRQIAKVRGDKQKLAKTFTGIYVMQIITSLIMIILYIAYLKILVHSNNEIATIQIIYLIATMFDINWLFFRIRKIQTDCNKKYCYKNYNGYMHLSFCKTKRRFVFIYNYNVYGDINKPIVIMAVCKKIYKIS